jgi:hypothetical protein
MSYGPDVIDPYSAPLIHRADEVLETWATHVAAPAQVSYWHKADRPVVSLNVRFRGQSGHSPARRDVCL